MLEKKKVYGSLYGQYPRLSKVFIFEWTPSLRIMSGKDDVSPITWFQTMNDNRGDGVGTRQATGLYNVLPKQGRSEIRTNFFSQRVVAPWNSLPNWVKQSTTVNMFKNRLDEHLEQGVLQPP